MVAASVKRTRFKIGGSWLGYGVERLKVKCHPQATQLVPHLLSHNQPQHALTSRRAGGYQHSGDHYQSHRSHQPRQHRQSDPHRSHHHRSQHHRSRHHRSHYHHRSYDDRQSRHYHQRHQHYHSEEWPYYDYGPYTVVVEEDASPYTQYLQGILPATGGAQYAMQSAQPVMQGAQYAAQAVQAVQPPTTVPYYASASMQPLAIAGPQGQPSAYQQTQPTYYYTYSYGH